MTTEGQQPAPGPLRSVGYDPAFRAAIEDGCLTVRQALQRGRRDQCASSLAAKHGLALELAFDVADNRTTLGQALRRQSSPLDDPVEQQASGRLIRFAWLALGAPLALFLGALVWYFAATPSKTEAVPPAPARVVRDDAGRITLVEAADPVGVLQAFCGPADANAVARCEAFGLLETARAAPRLRIGILADPGALERLLAISIRQDRGTLRWVAGDGAGPLEALLAPRDAAASLERAASVEIAP